jgi:hypothetical protein
MDDLLGSTLGQRFRSVSPLGFLHCPHLSIRCSSVLFGSSSLFLHYNHFSCCFEVQMSYFYIWRSASRPVSFFWDLDDLLSISRPIFFGDVGLLILIHSPVPNSVRASHVILKLCCVGDTTRMEL